MIGNRLVYGMALLACLAMIGAAFVFQFVLDLEPCPLCVIQRVVVAALGLLFLVAFLHGPARFGTRIYGALTVLTGGFGVAVAGRHVWLQNLPEEEVPGCGPGLEYILSAFPFNEAVELILRGSGECHEVAWSFLGLSIPGWTLIAFSLFVMFGLWQLARGDVGPGQV